ncbi:formyltransferase family protein, partial [Immundisolibacter sp.]|uniref:formyltetrahydrofolate deformylase n=1 Tax=Immundisolibacter sp. TaxID=1934948 RepID=UPI003563AA42
MSTNTAILLITCPDERGLVATVAEFLYRHGANILHADQHVDIAAELFFMRVEWSLADFDMPLADFAAAFSPLAEKLSLQWRLESSDQRQRVAIFASSYDHCLADLLYRHRARELHCDVPLVISNHEDTRHLVEFYDIPFHLIDVTPEHKADAEATQLALLEQHQVDLIVLARYMQIL